MQSNIKIVAMGVGGAGNSIVNRLIKTGVKGTDFVVVNTNVKDLKIIDNRIKKILIGNEQDRQKIKEVLSDAQLVFLCVGMGGGTGTGASPVIAQIAKEQGAIVVAMVTYPLDMERVRKLRAEEGIEELRKYADSLIILDNNRLLDIVPNLPINEVFAVADDVIAKAIGGLIWTITQPSLINIDFVDVASILTNKKLGFISIGTGKGSDKITAGAEAVIKNNLLNAEFKDVKGVLVIISGGADLTIEDVKKAKEIIKRQMPNANVKIGARILNEYEDKIEIVAICFL